MLVLWEDIFYCCLQTTRETHTGTREQSRYIDT